ncbi:MAG: DUF2948 family protein [Methylocystis sp.]
MAQSPSAGAEQTLGLHAVDEEDLAFISAHAQDALIRVSDLAYLPKQRRFALICARFDRVAEREGRRERRHAGLHFDGVTGVRLLQINLNQSEQVLALLAVTFEAIKDAPPSGVIRLIFAGGPEIELQVECIEAQMRDIGPSWRVDSGPQHNLDAGLDEEPKGRS